MPEDDLRLLESAAIKAGDIALGFWGNQPKSWAKPEGAGPVTEADLAVDDYLSGALRSARPDYGWLSEETEDDAARLDARHTLIVDPIDGTRAFMAGETNWAISLAIACDGQVETAAIYLPALQRIYMAQSKGGASLNGQSIHARSTPAVLEQADIIAAKANLDPAFWNGPVPAFTRHFRPSLAYRMALVAEGRYDAMLTFRPAWEWDIAAGALICTEAGAMATMKSGDKLTFNNPVPRLDSVLVAPDPLHSEIRQRLKLLPG